MIRKLLLFLTSMSAFPGLSGCHTLIILPRDGAPPVGEAAAPEKTANQGSVALGIYATSPPVGANCEQSPVEEIRIVTNFWDNMIHFFIGPFYTTKTVEVYCRK